MTKDRFDRAFVQRPGWGDHFLHWVFRILYLGSCIGFGFGLVALANFFREGAPSHGVTYWLVPSYANGVLVLSGLFLGFVAVYFPLVAVFRWIPGFVDTLDWYEVAQSKCSDFYQYRSRERRLLVLVVAVEVLATLGAIQSVRVHTVFREQEIVAVDFFDVAEKRIPWRSFEAIVFSIEQGRSRGGTRYANPSVELDYGHRRFDVWPLATKGDRVEWLKTLIDFVRQKAPQTAVLSRLHRNTQEFAEDRRLLTFEDGRDFDALCLTLGI